MAKASEPGAVGGEALTPQELVERFLEQARQAEEEDVYIALSYARKALKLVEETEGTNSSKYKKIQSYKKRLQCKARDENDEDELDRDGRGVDGADELIMVNPESTVYDGSLLEAHQPVPDSLLDTNTYPSTPSLQIASLHSGTGQALITRQGAELDSISRLKDEAPKSLKSQPPGDSQSVGITSRGSQTNLGDLLPSSNPPSHHDRLHAMTRTPLSLTQDVPESMDRSETSGKFHPLTLDHNKLAVNASQEPNETGERPTAGSSNTAPKRSRMKQPLSVAPPLTDDQSLPLSQDLSGFPRDLNLSDSNVVVVPGVQPSSAHANPLRQIPPTLSPEPTMWPRRADEDSKLGATGGIPQLPQNTQFSESDQTAAAFGADIPFELPSGLLLRTISTPSERAAFGANNTVESSTGLLFRTISTASSSTAQLSSALGRPSALPDAMLQKHSTTQFEEKKKLFDAHINMGDCYWELKPKKGAKQYERGFELVDNFPELKPPDHELRPLYRNTAIAHLNSGDPEAALVYCEKAEELSTAPEELAEIQDVKAKVHDAAGERDEADRCRAIAARNRQLM